MIVSKHSRNPYLIDLSQTLLRRHIPFIVFTGQNQNRLSQNATYTIHTPLIHNHQVFKSGFLYIFKIYF